ncbi:helix-turn-helix domain-containing protein [Faecalibacter sp. LW9]|uniref:helix-turn-helix domain-containing protein n=1 Tax=Faecalibacter sp. LW9 TaxID=3103144 RepID=UPI002AFEE6F3|nr:helix-turn-helix domain-containing protein [Faecalibacter sp. LW9]
MSNFKNIRFIDQKTIFDYIPLGHPHRPITPAILFVIKGSVQLKEKIIIHHMIENTIIFIDHNHIYEIIEVSDDLEIILLGYHSYYINRISLKLNKIKVYQGLKNQLKRKFIIDSQQMNILIDNIKKIEIYQKLDNYLTYIDDIIEHYFIIILFHITSIVEEDINKQYAEMTRQQKIVNDFIYLVSENYLEEKDIKYYAIKLSITVRYMSSVIKSETGKTPQQFMNEFILNEAKALLASTNKNIKEIAYLLKFSDQFSFSHFFKRHQKISPSDYRRIYLK